MNADELEREADQLDDQARAKREDAQRERIAEADKAKAAEREAEGISPNLI